jgi:hypothetical protein
MCLTDIVRQNREYPAAATMGYTWADENERQIASGIAALQRGHYDDKSEVGRTWVRRSQEDKRNKNGISF